MNASDVSSMWQTALLVGFGGAGGALLAQAVTWLRDREKAESDKKRKLQSLLAEIIDNLAHIDRHSLAGGRAIIKLLVQAWEATKGDMFSLDPELAQSLRKAYAEVWRFNCAVDCYLTESEIVRGSLKGSFEVLAAEVKPALLDSHQKLSRHLGVSI
ncbi:MAG: hypothetical protein BVN28_01995 [Nitrospira sp. ST-bin4]|nr:MAG: hypothetical protein BVN28_01995 [Nitrospira sp. ST-bin4]